MVPDTLKTVGVCTDHLSEFLPIISKSITEVKSISIRTHREVSGLFFSIDKISFMSIRKQIDLV
jgi:hypothetical protein